MAHIKTKVSKARALHIASLALAGDLAKLGKLRIPGKAVSTWGWAFRKFLSWFQAGMEGKAPFSVIAEKGNKKLPFFAFSSLPQFDCPGAGDCLKFCYSFKAWRYPCAFFRQLQNSLLLRSKAGRALIKKEWMKIPPNKTVRLYVDGDFANLEILKFWMDLCKWRGDLKVYGYSKSWALFLELAGEGYKFPSNYKLNLSSGSIYGEDKRGEMEALSVTRGGFHAVPVDKKWIQLKSYQDKTNPGSKEYRREVLQRLKEITAGTGKKMFACPGNCGNCMPNGEHACDSLSAEIGIGVHG